MGKCPQAVDWYWYFRASHTLRWLQGIYLWGVKISDLTVRLLKKKDTD